MERRKFIKASGLGLTAALVTPVISFASSESTEPIEETPALKEPKMISTWNHGIAANKAGWEVLMKGGSALDAVEAGARQTEADVSNRSVGIGGLPDRTGHVTLDACIMDWDSRCGSVGFLEGIAHPISVARHIMEHTPHVMLVGAGAKSYALKNDFDTIKTPVPEAKAEWKKWLKEQETLAKQPKVNHENHDTIGLLAMDANGHISGACTTSGWAYKLPGRLGDSPIIGASLFVDNEVGAAVATGLGESIIRIAGSHTVVEMMRHGMTPQEACEEAVNRIIRKHKNMEGNQCAFIAMDKEGRVGSYSVYNGFNYALHTKTEEKMVDAPFNRKW